MADAPNVTNLTPIPKDVFCPHCGYNLFATTAERCSECGYKLAGLRATESAIPWLRRRELGRLRAFWQTVWFVTVRHRKFCEEYVRPIAYKDARRFQWWVVLHVWLPIAAVVGWLNYVVVGNIDWETDDPFRGPSLPQLACADIWPAGLMLICFLLFLLAATGVQSYLFHPKRVAPARQNTAIALSYYACAPLAMTCVPIAAIPLVTGADAKTLFEFVSYYENTALAWGLALLIPALLTWIVVARTARRIMPQLVGRVWAVTACTPLLWLALAGLILVALPAAVVYVLVVFASFS